MLNILYMLQSITTGFFLLGLICLKVGLFALYPQGKFAEIILRQIQVTEVEPEHQKYLQETAEHTESLRC